MSEKSDTKTQILDVAEKAVLEKGFEATSIEEIVAAVGLSRQRVLLPFQRQERPRPRHARTLHRRRERAF